jgi:hypothetical protein
MKKYALMVLFIVIVSLGFSQFALGLMAGQPSGLSARIGMGDNLSLDLGAAYSFLWISGIHFHADIVYVDHSLLRITDRVIPLYIGGGIRYVGAYWYGLSYSTISARVPLGILYPFTVDRNTVLEFFAEIVPTAQVYPDFSFDVSFALGLRYRFPAAR